jgi:hypothetical protein
MAVIISLLPNWTTTASRNSRPGLDNTGSERLVRTTDFDTGVMRVKQGTESGKL